MGSTATTAAATWVVYQPLIVGLGAVVLATVGNTTLEWFRRSLHDRKEGEIVRRAFIEELRLHRGLFANAMSEDHKPETGTNMLIPIDRFMPVYDNMIARIGLLKPAEAAAVLKAYSHIILTPKNFALLGKIHRDDFASFVEVSSDFAPTLVDMNNGMVKVIDEALEVLG